MGDRSWNKVWVHKDDFVKYAAAIGGKDEEWVKENADLTPEDLMLAETVDDHGTSWSLENAENIGGGWDDHKTAAWKQVRFVIQAGGYSGSYTGFQGWSSGDGTFHIWEADGEGEGLLLDFSFKAKEDLFVGSKEVVEWGDRLTEQLRAFLVGLRRMHLVLGILDDSLSASRFLSSSDYKRAEGLK